MPGNASFVPPIVLSDVPHDVVLRPLERVHADALARVVTDGELWTIRHASVPRPEDTAQWVDTALRMRDEGRRFPFVVMRCSDGEVVGTTSYNEILPDVRRVEIGYTWYASSVQRTHVNTACKRLLLDHAFGPLACPVVGWRTDHLNLASQRAILRLGAEYDGVIRGHLRRRDGTIRDTLLYSLRAEAWPAARQALSARLERQR